MGHTYYDDEIAHLDGDADPPVLLVPHVEAASAAQHKPDLLVLVQVPGHHHHRRHHRRVVSQSSCWGGGEL